MRRPEKPWFRRSDRWWYVTFNGVQHKLAKGRENKAEAVQEFHKLMAGGPPTPAGKTGTRLDSLFELFLDFSQAKHARETYENYRYYLNLFAKRHGRLSVSDLKPIHLTLWLSDKGWSPTTEYNAITAVQRALNFAAKQGLIPRSPLAGMEKPETEVRDRIIEDDEWATIVGSVRDKDPFKLVLRALRVLGCRPSEVARVTAKHVDLSLPAWVFPRRENKTGKKTKKPRVIFLTASMVDLTKKLTAERPEGPLFRNQRGRPWNRNALRLRFARLRMKFPKLEGITCYRIRHTFCTTGVAAGVDVKAMMDLMGHTSPAMITKVYTHHRKEHLIDCLKKINDSDGGTTVGRAG